MKSKLDIFNKHKTEIKDRVIGSLVKHFIYQETGHFAITLPAVPTAEAGSYNDQITFVIVAK